MYLADDFRHALEGFDLAHLEATTSAVVGLRPDLTIAFANRAWRQSEGRCGCGPNGTDSYVEGVSAPLRPFYLGMLRAVQRDGEPAVHEFACPRPDSMRRYRLRVMPLSGGLLLIHHLIAEQPVGHPAHAAEREAYVDEHGMVHQCAHCRMVLRQGSQTWDWVPDWVVDPPRDTSHGLCPVCFRYHYPELAGKYLQQRSLQAG